MNSLRRNYNDLVEKSSKLQDELSYSISDASKSKSLLRSIQEEKGELLNVQNIMQ